jgi:uncharacterized protein (TIGR02453 family)
MLNLSAIPAIRSGAMTFQGWPEEALDFYEGLEADNSKTYWLGHKQTYESCVLAPMTELLAELAPEYGDGKIFRPYRDVRFSADKSPYKTAIGAVIGPGYVQLSARGLAAGTGMYGMAPDQLSRYRQAVAADPSGTELEQVVAGVRSYDIDVQGHETLKSAPRGYPADHRRIELLRCKGLVAWKEWEVRPWLGTAEARQRITDFLAAASPLDGWLEQHVGPSQADRR